MPEDSKKTSKKKPKTTKSTMYEYPASRRVGCKNCGKLRRPHR